jgi:hypothetical protein
MVESVTQDEALRAHERRDDNGVCGKAHPKGDCRLLSHKVRNQGLQLYVDRCGACTQLRDSGTGLFCNNIPTVYKNQDIC